jgi:hypothetical protein
MFKRTAVALSLAILALRVVAQEEPGDAPGDAPVGAESTHLIGDSPRVDRLSSHIRIGITHNDCPKFCQEQLRNVNGDAAALQACITNCQEQIQSSNPGGLGGPRR